MNNFNRAFRQAMSPAEHGSISFIDSAISRLLSYGAAVNTNEASAEIHIVNGTDDNAEAIALQIGTVLSKEKTEGAVIITKNTLGEALQTKSNVDMVSFSMAIAKLIKGKRNIVVRADEMMDLSSVNENIQKSINDGSYKKTLHVFSDAKMYRALEKNKQVDMHLRALAGVVIRADYTAFYTSTGNSISQCAHYQQQGSVLSLTGDNAFSNFKSFARGLGKETDTLMAEIESAKLRLRRELGLQTGAGPNMSYPKRGF